MKDYYLILGVERTATGRDIKRTYRRLAILYHPDKNPNQDAEDRFKEINEAYMVLSDPEAKASYDARQASPSFEASPDTESSWHRDPAYRRATSYRRAHGPSERRLFMESMLKYSRLLFYFGCFYSAVVIVDYLLPPFAQAEVVITDMQHISRLISRADQVDLLVTDQKHHFHVLPHEMQYFPTGSKVNIYTSRMLSALLKVENHDRSYIVNNLASIYRNFSFAPIMLLLTCLTGLVFRRGVEFHVNLGIVVFLLMILNIVFLFTSRL